MQKWQLFLNSLATPGGNVLLNTLIVTALLIVLVLELHHGTEGQVQTILVGSFTGFSGALLQSLRGRSADVPAPPGSTSTTTTASHSSEAPKEKVDPPELPKTAPSEAPKKEIL